MRKFIRTISVIVLVFTMGMSACKNESKTTEKKEVTTKIKTKKVAQKPKPAEKKKLEPVVEKVPNKYFLIKASFQNIENANRLQKQLTDQGYISEVHKASNGFHRVSYKAFSDRKRAFEELKSARSSEENKDNWLYIKQ